MGEKLSLIDRLANLLGCEYVNHLYHLRLLDRQQKSRLLDKRKAAGSIDTDDLWN